MSEENYEGCYGPKLTVSGIIEKLIQAFASDTEAEEKRSGERFSTVIWGRAGIGKTSLVRSLQNREVSYRGNTYQGYKIVFVPLADIEEVGDIIGMPERHVCVSNGQKEKWVPESCIGIYTEKFGYSLLPDKGVKQFVAPPEWVPVPDSEGYAEPTVILVDDFNRANLRVLKACMPLFQTYATIGWKLPKGCHIVLTGNPSQQDYQVTDIDPAILTRMRHITSVFDIKEWINWADTAGLDKNLLGFCAYYPEMMFGKLLTNPRTISEAFRLLKTNGLSTECVDERKLKNLKDSLLMLVDEDFVNAFVSYVVSGDNIFLSPEDILSDSVSTKKKISKLLTGSVKRLDIISIFSSRLVRNICSETIEFTEEKAVNFHSFLFESGLPQDIVMSALLEMNSPQNLLPCLPWMNNPSFSFLMSEYYSSKA